MYTYVPKGVNIENKNFVDFYIKRTKHSNPIYWILQSLPENPYKEININFKNTDFFKKIGFLVEIKELGIDVKSLKNKNKKEIINNNKLDKLYYITDFYNDTLPDGLKYVCLMTSSGELIYKYNNIALMKTENIKYTVIKIVTVDKLVLTPTLVWFQTEKKLYPPMDDVLLDTVNCMNSDKSYQNKVDVFYKNRHLYLQLFICKRYNLTFYNPIEVDLSFIDSKLTPDFFEYLETENDVVIGDIQVSRDTTGGYLNKMNKYNKVSEKLQSLDKNIIELYLVFDPLLRNMLDILNNIIKLPIIDQELASLEKWHIFIGYEEKLREDSRWKETVGNLFSKKQTEVKLEELRFSFQKDRKNFTKTDLVDEITEVYNNEQNNEEEMCTFLKKHLDSLDTDEETELCMKYKDKKFEEKVIQESMEKLEQQNEMFPKKLKPSFHAAIPLTGIDDLPYIGGDNSEQKMLINFAVKVSKEVSESFSSLFCTTLLKCLEDKEQEKIYFGESRFQNAELEAIARYEYHEYRDNFNKKIEEKDTTKAIKKKEAKHKLSFENFCVEKKYIKEIDNTNPRIEKNKMIRIQVSKLDELSKDFLRQSGMNFFKNHPEGRVYNDRHTNNIDSSYEIIEKFSRILNEESAYENKNMDEIFEDVGDDMEKMKNLKIEIINSGKFVFKQLKSVKCFRWLYHSSLFYEQLLHFGNYSVSSSKYSFFNTGIPNMMCVMTGGYRNFTQNNGKSYFVMGFTKNLNEIENIYGKLHIEKVQDDYFYRTRWFRLPGHRLEFLRDSFLSVLSSSISTLMRIRSQKDITREDIRGIFVIRSMIAMCPTSKFIEKMMDARYAILSSISEFTNFEELILSKFAPPYHNCLDAWVVGKLKFKLASFRQSIFKKGNIQFLAPVFNEVKQRSFKTVGGKISVRAIWSNRLLVGIQDILDELFIYVHTPKEPSNVFHEEVKSINTITEFQVIFNKMTKREQLGLHNIYELENWLLKNKGVGFNKDILIRSVKNKIKTLDLNMSNIENFTLTEKLRELTSTKAVIPDVDRNINQNVKIASKVLINLKNKVKLGWREVKKNFEEQEKIILERSQPGEYKHQFHLRKKVHDCICDLSSKNIETVYEAISYHISNNKERVVADICIKAQYGAKREFYVMNMGGKLMSRFVENIYKKISINSKEEMISVSGDNKFLRMQSMLDSVMYKSVKNNLKVIYINGDCSKWSAAETMESFITMNQTLKYENKELQDFTSNIFAQWADKKIQVPKNLVDKVFPLDAKTEYIKEASKNNYCLKSTQNFLQGVFNYSSSFKADCCFSYVIKIWNQLYPESEMIIEYLVHSDDYTFAIGYKDINMFRKFRILLKIIMRMCGITDSAKKTNCQYVFLEFISLISFNASMNYPVIKKTKEISSTLPCEGFKEDSDFVCSRTSECIRVGVDSFSSYIYHRIHMYLLRRMYGLHSKGRNFIENSLNTPVEFFGQSDMHPLFYLLCKGDSNNIRILHFVKEGTEFIKKLVNLAIEHSGIGDKKIISTFSPTFIYNRNNEKINMIRKSTGITSQDALEFWNKNIPYNFIKPHNFEDFRMWSLSKYFNSSFIKAYNRDTRTIRMLRTSFFNSGHCLTLKNYNELVEFYARNPITKKSTKTKLWKEEIKTIKQLQNYISDYKYEEIDQKYLLVYAYNGDATSESIYKWLETSEFIKTDIVYYQNTAASKIVEKPSWIQYSSSLEQLILYIYSKELFIKNFPNIKDFSKLKLEEDLLKQRYPILMKNIQDPLTESKFKINAMNLLHTMLENNKPQTQIILTKRRFQTTLSLFLKDFFEIACYPGFKTNVISKNIITSVNPYTIESSYILGSKAMQGPERHIAHELGLLLTYLLVRFNKSKDEILSICKKIKVNYNQSVIKLSEYLLRKDWYLNALAICNRIELMSYAFALLFLYDDQSLISKLSENSLFYSYKLDNSKEYKEKDNYKGVLKVHINYLNHYGVFYKYHNNGRVKLLTNCPFSNIALIIFEIGLMLTECISKQNFELNMGNIDKTKFEYKKSSLKQQISLIKIKEKIYKFKLNNFNVEYITLPVFYKKNLNQTVNMGVQDSQKKLQIFYIDNISIYKEKMKMFTLPYLKYTPTQMFTVKKKLIVNNINISSIINKSLYKEFLTPNYELVYEALDECIEGVKKKIDETFPFETVENFNIPQSPLTPTSKFTEEKDLMNFMDFDLSEIKLYQEEVGIIEEDKKELTLEDMYYDEAQQQESTLYDAGVDILLGDIGILKDIHFFSYDYKLPYSYKLAKNSCLDIKRVVELVINITTPKELRPREYIKYKLISWFLIRYGENLYEQKLGETIKEKLTLCKINNNEEQVNGFTCKSLDGKNCNFYKTNLYETEKLLGLKDENKIKNTQNMLWNGIAYKEFIEKYVLLDAKQKEKMKYINLYKETKLNLNGILILLNKEKKTSVITYKQDYTERLIIKLQKIIENVEDEFLS
jgi:hypothetical protein